MEKRVSIIVTAFNRKEFIIDALKSIERQTIDKSLFEVIFFRNFEDETLNKSFETKGWIKTFIPSNNNIGNWLAEGILAAKGDVICFLDDDDLYHPQRLEKILFLFDRYEDIALIRNDIIIFSHFDKITFDTLDYSCNNFKIFWSAHNIGEIARLVRKSAALNLSSIAIRKSLFSDSIKGLDDLVTGPDFFMLYSCIASGNGIALLDEKLSYYRIHESTVHSKSDDLDRVIEKELNYGMLFTFALDVSMKPLALKSSNFSLLRFISYQESAWRVRDFMISRNGRITFRALCEALVYSLIKFDIVILIGVIFGLLKRIGIISSDFYLKIRKITLIKNGLVP